MAFEDLYQEIILDHYRHPRNKRDLSNLTDSISHENPTCGDSIKLFVKVSADGIVEEVSFDGHGCAISTSSASMMTDALKGKTLEEAERFADSFIHIMRGEEENTLEDHGELVALGGVIQFPVRVKCATLAWHAFQETMKKKA